MRKKLFIFLASIAFASASLSVQAGTASVSTVPEGLVSFTLQSGSTNYLSIPLTSNETYVTSVTSVTTNSISVGDVPAPFTTNLALPGAPYFVKFLTGNETGRVLLITSNTSSSLSLDTTDHATGTPVLLNTSGFNVQVGDTFEIFPGDTLASVFGSGTKQNPLLLKGGANLATSDTVVLYTTGTATNTTYYFNTAAGFWTTQQVFSPVNANNTVIYPYSAMTVTRLSSHPTITLTFGGKVTPVPAQTKVVSNGTVYSSTHYATGIKLSQLQFGSNWTRGTSVVTADTISVWDAATNQFDTFYQLFDATWRKYPDTTTDQSNFTIAPGTVTTIAKHEAVAGAATFLQSQLPYNLD